MYTIKKLSSGSTIEWAVINPAGNIAKEESKRFPNKFYSEIYSAKHIAQHVADHHNKQVKVTRVNTGVYDVEYKGYTFYVERESAIAQDAPLENDHSWRLTEVNWLSNPSHDYMSNHQLKRDAIRAIMIIVDNRP